MSDTGVQPTERMWTATELEALAREMRTAYEDLLRANAVRTVSAALSCRLLGPRQASGRQGPLT